MDRSKIYDLIIDSLLFDWIDKLEKEDKNGFKKSVERHKQELCSSLNEEQKKLVNVLQNAINYFWQDIYYFINIRILNLGIQAGMQLQQAFESQDDI